MSNHFNKVTIENFKSIKKIDFHCKRINLFLGEPNVGKSNILEALALFSAPFSMSNNSAANNKLKSASGDYYFAWDQIRYKNIRNLFFFQDNTNEISVSTDKGVALLKLSINQQELYEFFIGGRRQEINDFINTDIIHPLAKEAAVFENLSIERLLPNYYTQLNKLGGFYTNNITSKMNSYQGFVKKYVFNETYFEADQEHNKFPFFLMPSYGTNIFTIVNAYYELADLVSGFFEKYNLELIFIPERNEYLIQRKQGRVATQLPYDSIADTLQRIIFHLAAIYSNKDSVLIFEEPEAHTSPAYISRIANEVIKSKTNQFFVTSHNPYFVENIIENAPEEEVAVFVCSYRNHETMVRELSSNDLSSLKKYKYDLVYNIATFEE